MKKIALKIGSLLGWDKNPSSVFYIAAPLALLGFSLVGVRAFLAWHLYSDPWYLVIFAIGLALLVLALWPIRKLLFK